MANLDEPSDTGGTLIAANQVNGTSVYNRQRESLGSIYDVMIDKTSGEAQYAIMSFGGFLGMGESYHPLPWKALTYDTAQGGYVVNLTKQQLEGAPYYGASGTTSCTSRFNGPNAREPAATQASLIRLLEEKLADGSGGGTGAPLGSSEDPTTGLGQAGAAEEEPGVGSASATEGTEPLLDYLLGP